MYNWYMCIYVHTCVYTSNLHNFIVYYTYITYIVYYIYIYLRLLKITLVPYLMAQFSYSVMSNFLQPHGLQHTRLPCPSPTPGVHSNSCPSSWWYHPTISSSVVPFSSYLQSFPASGFFQEVSSLHQVAKVLEFQLQHQSFQWRPRTDLL